MENIKQIVVMYKNKSLFLQILLIYRFLEYFKNKNNSNIETNYSAYIIQ